MAKLKNPENGNQIVLIRSFLWLCLIFSSLATAAVSTAALTAEEKKSRLIFPNENSLAQAQTQSRLLKPHATAKRSTIEAKAETESGLEQIPMIETLPIWEEVYFPSQNPPDFDFPHLQSELGQQSGDPENVVPASANDDEVGAAPRPSWLQKWWSSIGGIHSETRRSLLTLLGCVLFLLVIVVVRMRYSRQRA